MVDRELGSAFDGRLFELREIVIEVEDSGIEAVPRIVFGRKLALTVRNMLLNDGDSFFESDAADLDEALGGVDPEVLIGTWTVHALRRVGQLHHPDLPPGYLAEITALEQALSTPNGEIP